MVDALPGMPGDAGTLPCYRGDPFAQAFQFVDADTTGWIVLAQLRRRPDGEVLAEFTVETNFEGDPELVNMSLTEEETAELPASPTTATSPALRLLVWDLERRETVSGPLRTMLKGFLDVDPDVTREEGS